MQPIWGKPSHQYFLYNDMLLSISTDFVDNVYL